MEKVLNRLREITESAFFLILWHQLEYSQGLFLTICDVAF